MTSTISKVLSARVPNTCALGHSDVQVLVTEGAQLFAKLKMTPRAQEYLDEHPKLKEAIDKW